MKTMRLVAATLAACAALFALPAAAEDTALLIQLRPDGRYTVWHAGDSSPLGENDILALEAAAVPEGSRRVMTSAGLAQAFDTPNGIQIHLPGLGPERALLIDRDGCGGIKLWHSHGNINPSEEELTELVLSALPEGGKRIAVGRLSAKAYSTKIGVIAVIWRPVARPRR
jgi:ABC-type amino acid transport substrate-binding protein